VDTNSGRFHIQAVDWDVRVSNPRQVGYIHQDAFINRSRNQAHIVAGRKSAFKRREQSTLQVLPNSMPLELRSKYDMGFG
jgi:hypothetical protein